MPRKNITATLLSLLTLWAFNTNMAYGTVADGVMAHDKGDYAHAREEWLPYAALGDANALFNLAQLYRLGQGVEVDYDQAQEYYLRAAQKGHVNAQSNLGTLHYFGKIRNASRTKAYNWWKAAAERSDGRSQYLLGIMYYNGDTIARNDITAYAWISMANQNGIAEAAEAEAKIRSTLSPWQLEEARKLSTTLLTRFRAPDQRTLMVASDAKSNPLPQEQKPFIRKDPPSPASSDIFRVQLAAHSSEERAQKVWQTLQKKFPDLLQALTSKIQFVDPGSDKPVVYRLQIAPFEERSGANELCEALKDRGQDCFVVKTPR